MGILCYERVTTTPGCRFPTLFQFVSRRKTLKTYRHQRFAIGTNFFLHIPCSPPRKHVFTQRPVLSTVGNFPVDYGIIIFTADAQTQSYTFHSNQRPTGGRTRTQILTRKLAAA